MAWMMGVGQSIPVGLSYPQSMILRFDWLWILLALFIALTCIEGQFSQHKVTAG